MNGKAHGNCYLRVTDGSSFERPSTIKMAPIILGLIVCLTCAVSAWLPARAAQDKTPRKLVQDLVRGFNTHEFDAMAPYLSDDVQWLSIAGDSIAVEADGKDELRKAMKSYFSSISSTRSEIVDAMVSAPYVIVRERVNWRDGERPRSQSALAVYQIENDLIARVWYFPADGSVAWAADAPASDEARVRAVLQAYVQAWLANEPDRVMETLAQDPVLMPAGREPLVGRAAARAFWFPAGPPTIVTRYEDSIEDIALSGDMAYARGMADMDFQWEQDGTIKKQSNHTAYLTVLIRGTDGRWRIARRMWGRISD